MNNKEYEYSFKVSDVSEYIKYCIDNHYELVDDVKQIRTIYRNKNGFMARITVLEGDKITKKLDFKEDKLTKKDLNIRKESKELLFDNVDDCEDILDFLGYKKDNTLIRIRKTYKKNGVIFEIDEYFEPRMKVVAIEGNPEEVDVVYKELERINIIYRKI